MGKSIAITDAETRRTLLFSSPPWRLKKLKCGIRGCRVTLIHQDGTTHGITTGADEKSVRERLKGW